MSVCVNKWVASKHSVGNVGKRGFQGLAVHITYIMNKKHEDCFLGQAVKNTVMRDACEIMYIDPR